MSGVTIQYFKYPDQLHWRHDTTRLGADEFGVWLGIPAAATVQRGHEPAMAIGRDAVQLITPDRWWSLIYNGDADDFEVYVDIATPPVWEADDRVTMFDLDLDVVRHQDGTVQVLDEDEFLDHQVRFAYPERLIAAARASTAEVVLALKGNREPFATVAASWLARLNRQDHRAWHRQR
jgi:protein associated with RNAse G/E